MNIRIISNVYIWGLPQTPLTFLPLSCLFIFVSAISASLQLSWHKKRSKKSQDFARFTQKIGARPAKSSKLVEVRRNFTHFGKLHNELQLQTRTILTPLSLVFRLTGRGHSLASYFTLKMCIKSSSKGRGKYEFSYCCRWNVSYDKKGWSDQIKKNPITVERDENMQQYFSLF